MQSPYNLTVLQTLPYFCLSPLASPLQAWSEDAVGRTASQPAALPVAAPEPQFSHPVPAPQHNATGEPYTLSPGTAVAIAAAQHAEHPTQRGSAAAAAALPAADVLSVRMYLVLICALCKMLALCNMLEHERSQLL